MQNNTNKAYNLEKETELFGSIQHIDGKILDRYAIKNQTTYQLHWQKMQWHMNAAIKQKWGPSERMEFALQIPGMWELINILGDPASIEWMRKKLTRYAKATGTELPDLTTKPRGVKDLIEEAQAVDLTETFVEATHAETTSETQETDEV